MTFLNAGARGWREAAHVLAICALAAGVISQAAFVGLDYHHDGLMLKAAMDVAGGKALFRETFAMCGPLTIWLQAFFIHMFGSWGMLYALRLSTLVFYVLAFALAWLLWRSLLPPGWSSAACLITLGMAPFFLCGFLPWSSVYALVFLLTAPLMLLRYLATRRAACLVAAGAATALAFWCRQPVGIVMVAAFLLCLLVLRAVRVVTSREALSGLACGAGGWFAVGAIFAAVLVATGALDDWWRQNILYIFSWHDRPADGVAANPQLLRSLFPGFGSAPAYAFATLTWSLFPLFCVLALAQNLRYCRRTAPDAARTAAAATVVSMYALASWHQYYPETCVRHLYWGAFPMFGLVVYQLRAWVYGVPLRPRAKLLTLLIALACVFSGEIAMRVTAFAARAPHRAYSGDGVMLRGIRFMAAEGDLARLMESTIAAARAAAPDRRLLNCTEEGFFAWYEPHNFHPLFVDWGAHWRNIYPDYYELRRAYIERERPIIVAYPGAAGLPAGYRLFAEISERGARPGAAGQAPLVAFYLSSAAAARANP